MSARLAILASIKAVLRARKIPYRDLARAIKVSEATIKRDLSRGTFSLARLDAICTALGVGLSDLVEAPDDRELVTQLTQAQEIALAGDPRALVVTYLILGDWKFAQIVSAFEMNENQLIEILLRLDRLGIIEYRPPHRMRKLTARNFSWRKDGPVHEFFVSRFVPEFFRSGFDAPADAFRFVGGTLSSESAARFKASLERLAAQFEQLAHHDARLPLERRSGCSAILAVRSFEFSEFTRLRRRGSSAI
ncbi:MAG TPA: helix-turn-helix transcriptional regulator [Steroidobacteraceae bacterium]